MARSTRASHDACGEAGGAGMTTIRGEWGFSSDERPYGDRSAPYQPRPTYTVLVDRPQKVAELWPLVDELTAEHGVVTPRSCPATASAPEHCRTGL